MCLIFLLSVFTSSLLKPDEQTGIRQIEQLKLVVTETLTISSRQWGYGIDRRLVQCENLRELAVMRRAPHDAFNAVTVILKWRISNSHLHVKM